MAQYRVLRKSYIHDRLYEPGEIVEWEGEPGEYLEPLGDEKRPPEPSRITGMPGPDPAAPPPQSEGKSEFDEGGPTRATALREYDEKRQADKEADVLPNEPQILARQAEAEGAQSEPGKAQVPTTDEGPITAKPKKTAAPKPPPAEE